MSAIINNMRTGANWGVSGGWNDNTANAWPDWVQINFNGSKTIDHVVVYTVQDNYANPVEPTDTMTFSLYGITAFTVQGWNGSAWVSLGSVSGNNLVKRTVNFSAYHHRPHPHQRHRRARQLLPHHRSRGLGRRAPVGPDRSTTTMASSLNPSTAGASVTFTATVAGSNPTGSVNFKDGANSISGCSADRARRQRQQQDGGVQHQHADRGDAQHHRRLRRRRRQCRLDQCGAVAGRQRAADRSTSHWPATAASPAHRAATAPASRCPPSSTTYAPAANWGVSGGWNDNTANA